MKNIAEKIRKYAKPYLLLILLIAAQLIYTSFCFVTKKQGCHSDEIWSYGLANSYYQPFIYMKDGVFIDDMTVDDVINYNEWESGKVFKDYITVQPGERFAYGSVYHNQTLDHHPPLYYMLLHTVCSFFTNSFSLYYSFFLNCIFLTVTQVFLYKLSKLILKSDHAALLPCILYGAGTGALSTFVFLRQYSLLTALGVMYTYFSAKLYLSENFDLKKHLAPVLITSFLMFMTHYNSIAYVGIFTACMCIYLLCKKKIKKLFIYGGSQLATLGLFFAVYPAGWKQIMGNQFSGEKAYTFFEQIRIFTKYVTKYNLGFGVSVYKSATYSYVIAALVFILMIMLPLCFLFRKEKWFISAKKKAFSALKNSFLNTKNWLKRANYIPLFALCAVIAEMCTANYTTNVLTMGVYSMRYIFMTFPIACMIAVAMLERIISKIPKIKKAHSAVCLALVAAIAVRVNFVTDCQFYFEMPGGKFDAAKEMSGKNCVLVMDSLNDTWRLTNFSMYLYDADNVFVTLAEDLPDNIEKINSLGENIDCILVTNDSYALSDKQKTDFEKNASEKIKFRDSDEADDTQSNVSDDGAEELEKIMNGNSKNDNIEEYTKLLNSLFGSEELSIKGGMNINGGEYFLLEHE